MSERPVGARAISHRGYAICGEPRVGSAFLARLIRSTGVLGDPFEFFNTPALAKSAERDPAQLDRLVARASSANGVYGLKIFAHQFDRAEKSRWAEQLPALAFIHLERDDLLGQAISFVLARQTGRYQDYDKAIGAPRYDGGQIAVALARIAHNQARWRVWFARNAIAPLRLTYEELAADPHGAVVKVAALVGVEGARADPDSVNVSVLRDERNEEWRRRFRADRGDLSYLDAPYALLPVALRRLRSKLAS